MLNPTEKQDPKINWKDLSFRRRSRVSEGSGNDRRFAIGLGVFILVALLLPWYAYAVVSYSIERDARRAFNDFGVETKIQLDEIDLENQRQHAASVEYQERQRNAAAELKSSQRVAGVRVMGVSAGGDLPTVLVSLGNSNTYEAERTICNQAGAWLNKNVSGTTLRLQKHRGNQPAADVGEITCP
jgi:hypothetical protein